MVLCSGVGTVTHLIARPLSKMKRASVSAGVAGDGVGREIVSWEGNGLGGQEQACVWRVRVREKVQSSLGVQTSGRFPCNCPPQ